MKLEDVKNRPQRERRICRANLRLYPSQMKFIDKNDISFQALFDKALQELGHVAAKDPEEIEKLAKKYKDKESKEKRKSSKTKKGSKR